MRVEQFSNRHRPHQGIPNARLLRPLPAAVTGWDTSTPLPIGRHDRLGGILNKYEHWLDLP
jgi:hypothetical protein